MNQFTDYFFWFVQPGSILSSVDWIFGYGFLGLFAFSLILGIAKRFVAHPVLKKLLTKIFRLSLTISILGILWLAFRYEVTPIFARRFWAGLVILGGLVWVGFILKYLIFNFSAEKSEHERLQIKNKYLKQKQ